MNKIYLKLLVGIIVGLWAIYFFQQMFKTESYLNCPYRNKCGNPAKCSDCPCKREGFTSAIRPYIRNINKTYDNLVSNYGLSAISHKLKKWNIYG